MCFFLDIYSLVFRSAEPDFRIADVGKGDRMTKCSLLHVPYATSYLSLAASQTFFFLLEHPMEDVMSA